MATMSNEQIILSSALELMEQGILKGSGKFLPLDDGTVIELPETIHTYNGWKARGYQVQKGQKSVATIRIWKHGKSKSDDVEAMTESGNVVTVIGKGHFFLQKAFFFTAEQVAPITANA